MSSREAKETKTKKVKEIKTEETKRSEKSPIIPIVIGILILVGLTILFIHLGMCSAAKCQNNASCTFGKCKCKDNFSGTKCETAPTCTKDTDCSGNGTCGKDGKCICAAGFAGPKCDLPISTATCTSNSNCPANSTCTGGKCVCNTDWVGNMCDRMVTTTTCTGVGGCPVNSNCLSNGKCVCNSGFTGAKCDQPVNPTPTTRQCTTAADCPNPNNSTCSSNGMCICKSGWSGPNCDQSTTPAPPTPSNCSPLLWTVIDRTDISFQKDIGSPSKVSNVEECQAKCQTQSGCVAAVMSRTADNDQKSDCFLKTSVTGPTASNNYKTLLPILSAQCKQVNTPWNKWDNIELLGDKIPTGQEGDFIAVSKKEDCITKCKADPNCVAANTTRIAEGIGSNEIFRCWSLTNVKGMIYNDKRTSLFSLPPSQSSTAGVGCFDSKDCSVDKIDKIDNNLITQEVNIKNQNCASSFPISYLDRRLELLDLESTLASKSNMFVQCQ